MCNWTKGFFYSRKRVILSDQKFDFLKDLVQNLPDASNVSNEDGGENASTSSGAASHLPKKRRAKPKSIVEPGDKRPRGRYYVLFIEYPVKS